MISRKIIKCLDVSQREPAAASRLLSMGRTGSGASITQSPLWTPITFTQCQTMFPFCQQDSFHLFERSGLPRYLDRKCIVLPARCCSAFPFNTRPLILQPSSRSRSFVRLWHVPLHRHGCGRQRSRRCFLPLVTDELPVSVSSVNRLTHSRSGSTLTHADRVKGGGDEQLREAWTERKHPEFFLHLLLRPPLH